MFELNATKCKTKRSKMQLMLNAAYPIRVGLLWQGERIPLFLCLTKPYSFQLVKREYHYSPYTNKAAGTLVTQRYEWDGSIDMLR